MMTRLSKQLSDAQKVWQSVGKLVPPPLMSVRWANEVDLRETSIKHFYQFRSNFASVYECRHFSVELLQKN